MSTPNSNQPENPTATSTKPGQKGAGKQKIVHSANFRSAGRLSNEDARTLTAIHETFAFHLAGALDTYLGTAVEVKLETLDQLPIKEHIANIPPMCYIVPLSQKTLIVELDNELIFPIIELLMGGTGTAQTAGRDLSEIESEIMQMVVSLMARQAETVWKIPDLALEPGSRMKPALMHQSFALTEKATVLKFRVDIAGSSGTFKLVFPTEFLNVLMARIKLDQPVKKTRIWSFPAPPLRERILDCDFDICSELPGLKVAVRDLIALQPGSVLKLRAPVRNPGMLTVGGREFFEAIPVRNGQLRAAQLGERIGAAEWKRS